VSDAWIPVVGTLAGAVLGAIIGAGSAYIIARQNRDEARRSKLLERQVDLFVDFLIAADVHAREVAAVMARVQDVVSGGADPATIPPLNPTEPIRRSGLALQIVAPSVEPAATRLYMAAVRLDLATEPARLDPTHTTFEMFGNYRAAVAEHEAARLAFLEAVRGEMGE
jgi:hypothetical protein